MSYPFSIFGTIIYLIYLAIVLGVIVVPLYLLIKNKSWKWFVITPIALVLIAAPVAEELWIQYHFETLCNDAGIHVKRKVKVDGYLDMTYVDPNNKNKIINDPGSVRRMEKEKFKFWEVQTKNNKVRHREIKDGKIEQTILDKPQSRYYLSQTDYHTKAGHKLRKFQFIIKDSVDDVISRDTTYARYPGFIESLWIRYLGSGQKLCYGAHPGESKLRDTLESYTFIAKKNN